MHFKVITNNLGETITYVLNALGNRTSTTIKSATSTIVKQQTATFDELGRMLTEVGAASQTTTYGYDKDDNQTSVTDPRSKLYQYAFDPLNRLYQETDPDTFQTTTGYNGKDEVTSVTDARTLVTTYVRDGFGDAIQQTSPDTGTTTSYFDASGNVTETVDARGFEVDYTYDAASRVKSKVVPGHSPNNITYGYDATAGGNDGVGRLTSVVDPAGTTRFVYNALGQVITETRIYGSHTYATGYTYDPSGHLLTSTSPSGRIVTFGRDALGRISGIASKQNSGATAATVTASVQYLPFGGYTGATFGNGVVQALGFDLDYQIHTINAANGATSIQNLTYTPDPAGNITGIADALASSRTQSLTYDDLNRVYTASGLYGSQSYTYDSDGNRLTRAVGATTDTYAYPPTSNRLSTVTTGANVRGFTYAASGQVTEDVRDPSHDYTFPLTRYGRIASAALNGSTAGTYIYDAFENRVQKTAGTTVTDYIYDRFGHLLYEANDATGALTREYVWQDDLPVAIVDDTGASPVVYYIQADHLGTPQKITDGSSAVVWDGALDPFGNPASITGALTNNLRFPGQYSDAETSLNQNWYRDYDPTLGDTLRVIRLAC